MSLSACETAEATAGGTPAAPASASSLARPEHPRLALAAAAATGDDPATAEPAPETIAAPAGPCPSEMVQVGRACVDRHEAQLSTDDGAVHSPYERPVRGVRYVARSGPGIVPQAYVNRHEAQAACEAAGKRLCSVREWYAACRGTRQTTYPYGPSFVAGKCNTGKPHLLSRYFGTNPRAWKYAEHFNSPALNREPGFLALTGKHDECVSDYGVYDMVGNLHEWVSDTVDFALATKLPLRDDIRNKLGTNYGKGVFMGGFYSTGGQHGHGCGFVTIGHEARYHDYSTGFRCCRDAGL
jgi:formylglycine-generating enzyme